MHLIVSTKLIENTNRGKRAKAHFAISCLWKSAHIDKEYESKSKENINFQFLTMIMQL
jgi:hypothetical protein